MMIGFNCKLDTMQAHLRNESFMTNCLDELALMDLSLEDYLDYIN